MAPITLALVDMPALRAMHMDGQNHDRWRNDLKVLVGHEGTVTCLYTPVTSSTGAQYLVSGGIDCTVRIWNVECVSSLEY